MSRKNLELRKMNLMVRAHACIGPHFSSFRADKSMPRFTSHSKRFVCRMGQISKKAGITRQNAEARTAPRQPFIWLRGDTFRSSSTASEPRHTIGLFASDSAIFLLFCSKVLLDAHGLNYSLSPYMQDLAGVDILCGL